MIEIAIPVFILVTFAFAFSGFGLGYMFFRLKWERNNEKEFDEYLHQFHGKCDFCE